MARSAEAMRKRALKRNRSEEEQRRFDAGDMKKRLTAEAEKRQKIAGTSHYAPQPDRKSEFKDSTGKAPDRTAERGDIHPLDEPGAWKCPGCGNRNFASRRVCHSETCEEKRPSGVLVMSRQGNPRRHDPATSKQLKWAEQADPEKLELNQLLREVYLKTGGEGMDEADVNRATILLERDERKKLKKAKRTKGKSAKTKKDPTKTSEPDQDKMVIEGEDTDEADATPTTILLGKDEKKKLKKLKKKSKGESTKTNQSPVKTSEQPTETKEADQGKTTIGGEGMDEDDAKPTTILLEKDEQKKLKKANKKRSKEKSTKKKDQPTDKDDAAKVSLETEGGGAEEVDAKSTSILSEKDEQKKIKKANKKKKKEKSIKSSKEIA